MRTPIRPRARQKAVSADSRRGLTTSAKQFQRASVVAEPHAVAQRSADSPPWTAGAGSCGSLRTFRQPDDVEAWSIRLTSGNVVRVVLQSPSAVAISRPRASANPATPPSGRSCAELHDADVSIPSLQFLENRKRLVDAAIVDEDQLVRMAPRGERVGELPVQRLQVWRFVVDRDDDRELGGGGHGWRQFYAGGALRRRHQKNAMLPATSTAASQIDTWTRLWRMNSIACGP